MRLSTIRYYFREAVQSILRNSWLSAASVGVVAVSLLILGSSLLLVVNAGQMAANLESNIEISLFLKDNTTPAQVKQIEDKIKTMPDVAQVEFVTKQRALEEMKKNLGDKKDILTGLEEKNPLPDAFKIKTRTVEQVAPLARQLESLPQADQVRYGQGVVENLMAFSRWVRTAGLVLMILLGVAAVFLIATTIRLSVFARRREIGIMKFLGATNWFVRFPFLLEGIFLGLTGSLVAVFIIFFGYYSLIGSVQISLPFLQLVSDRNLIMPLMEGLLLLGLFIGAAGSMISMRKFLKA
ncbi:MAG: Cell division protein FtsX [Pelotomaculum sp. PtaB.Bin013]|uniref:Cell division protein FtsX n=1 Tax=Pelotomaculum isophthalicicum JI TaxID=947010 RepID=A0A9X4JV70_9FIRM|nr:permease-like cell division protein FtsX [Pelotomaculum isophthalicicum]MDF9406988.1 permease-like cell division protein FtsX [Pelotomaculum isophthalicicum JI]OPX84928.1 MAG: Cell division protein FtsX [Pelotomaculum sp. PtaB.Bin013]